MMDDITTSTADIATLWRKNTPKRVSSMKKFDWEDIKFLGAIATNKTVRAAARQLKVHHSTVSRRIESLEHAADCRLVFRTPEGYVLTEAGELLANSAGAMELEVSRVQRLISGGDQEMAGQIVISMAEPLAIHAFAPRLPEFRQKYPNLEVAISSSNNMVDLSRQKADVAIRMTNQPEESLFGKRLFPYYNAVYASQEYIKKVDLLSTPENAVWIGWRRSFDRHPEWVKSTEFNTTPVWGSFPDIAMQTELARAGLGLAYLPCFIGDRDKQLVRVSQQPPQPGRDIWILTHVDLRRARRIKAFMAFAEKVLHDNRDLIEGNLHG